MARESVCTESHRTGRDARRPIEPTTRLRCDACASCASVMGCTGDGWHFWLCEQHSKLTGAEAVRLGREKHGVAS